MMLSTQLAGRFFSPPSLGSASMNQKIIPDVVNNQTVCTVKESDTARAAAEAMVRENIAAVIVTDRKSVV